MANFNIDYLVVAGGGGGGNAEGASGSGGGAGEYLYQTGQSLTTGGSGYTVTVGAGGSGGAGSSYPSANGLSGSDSFFVRSVAGGGAGLFSSPGNLLQSVPGGSGGGARPGSGSGAASTAVAPGVGNAGGSSSGNGGGGGGGAGSLGTTGTTSLSGSGGNGLQNSITGVSTYYAGGGAGGNFAPTGGSIGSGGSGIGGTSSYTGTAGSGVNNTGSGGAGGSYATSTNPYIPYAGGDGGSGIVILRYPTADVASYTTTGISPTQTTNGTDTILSFTTVGTGTITFTPPPPPPPPFDGTKATTPVTGFDKINTTQGLKLPSGTNTNQPTGVQGMIRNDTNETTGSSASAIEHHNGTNWQYFAATESLDPPDPLILSSVMYYSASDTTSYPGSGTDWFDLSGNSNTATITSSNYSNGYFDLTPTASIITTPVNTLYQTFSYSIWVKFDSVTPASGYVFTMLSKNQFYASNHQAFPFYAAVASTGTFTSNLSYGNDYSPDVTNSTSVSANTWYNIACVIDTTTNTSKLYIGTESTQLALVNSVSYTGTLVDSRNEFYSLGKAPAERSGGIGTSSMNGKIAKFGFWDTALTEAELITIWGLGSGAS